MQSFQSKHLKELGRYYNQKNYENILELLQNSKIPATGCDLMYGIHGQTKKDFFDDVKKCIEGKVNHLSLYSLTAEKGTDYARKIQAKKKIPPNEDLQSEILTELPDFLSEYGFEQYEVSNYAKKGFASKHNLKYWTAEYYLAIGPGAHGFTRKGRYANSKNINSYLQNQFSMEYETPIYLDELFLTLFRIFYPIHLDSFLLTTENKKNLIKEKIHSWAKNGFCDYKNEIFQWKKNSVLRLDDFILEISNI